MPTLSLAIQKGGSGKTTTAVNLAAALQQMGKRVLLVDLDPQANLTQALGLLDEVEPSIYHLLQQEAAGRKADLRSIITERSGLPLVPASLELAGAELELVSVYGREQILTRLLKPLRQEYEFILIDCPPAIGMLTVNALVASDHVIIPLNAEFLAWNGLKSFLRHFDLIKNSLHKKLDILGFVLTRFDPRKTMNRSVQERLIKEFGPKVFHTVIRVNIALAQAQEKGLDIFHHDMSAHGAVDHLELAQEVLGRLKKNGP